MKGRVWEFVLIGLGVIFYLLLFPHNIGGDGYARYTSLLRTLETGHLEPMFYSYVGPLFSLPLQALGSVIKTPFWWVSRFNTFLLFVLAYFLAKEFSREWSPKTVARFVLILFFASMFPKHSTDYYGEVFTVCFAALAFVYLLRDRFFLGALLLSLSAWNTPATLVGVVIVFLFLGIDQRKLRYFLWIPIFALGFIVETYLKFGEFFPTTYLSFAGPKNILPYSGKLGFPYPLWFGLLSVFLSFGKGLLFFSPALACIFSRAVWRPKTFSQRFILVGVVYLFGLILVYSRYFNWSGDWFWGPRFYLFASVLSAVIFAHLEDQDGKSWRLKAFCFFALALSLWVGCQGVMYGQDFLEDCYRNGNEIDFMCHYVPEFSVLWRFFVVWPTIQGRKVAYLIYFLLVGATLLWGPGKELLQQWKLWLREFFVSRWSGGKWRV